MCESERLEMTSSVTPPQSAQWKSGGREITKPGLHMQGRDPVFTSPMSAAKPSTPVSAPQHNPQKEVSAVLSHQRRRNETRV